MKRLETLGAWLFGAIFLLLSFAVAVETMMRKVFNVSLQGVDELGGYALAIGAALAFAWRWSRAPHPHRPRPRASAARPARRAEPGCRSWRWPLCAVLLA